MSNDPREQQKRRRIEIGSQYFHQHTYFLHRYIVRPCAETRAPLFELMRQYEAEVAAGMVEPVEFV